MGAGWQWWGGNVVWVCVLARPLIVVFNLENHIHNMKFVFSWCVAILLLFLYRILFRPFPFRCDVGLRFCFLALFTHSRSRIHAKHVRYAKKTFFSMQTLHLQIFLILRFYFSSDAPCASAVLLIAWFGERRLCRSHLHTPVTQFDSKHFFRIKLTEDYFFN